MDLTAALHIAIPELILAVGALALLATGAFAGDKYVRLISTAAVVVLCAAAIAAARAAYGSAFGGGFVSDSATAYAKVAIYLLSAVGIVLGDPWLVRVKNSRFEYPVLILLAALGMGMMASSGDLISLYIGVELFSLATYVLAAFQRDDAKSSEAGLKYFVLGALSSGILLYGASLVYGFSGSVRFTDIAFAVKGGTSAGVIFGLVFLICGLAFKVSAAPFHMWTPDVYEGAPTPVVAFIGAAPKLAAMVLFARAVGQAFPGATHDWGQVVVAIGVISVTVGAFAGLVQKNLKRLLAYSSIANIGYALIGLSAGTQEGVQSLFLFMTLYTIDVTGFFACLIALQRSGKPIERLEDFAGLIKTRPGIAFALTALSLSVLGLPPFSGFWSKFFVFKAAIAGGQTPAAVFALVMSVVAAFYYLRLIKTMWFDAPAGEAPDRSPLEARGVAYAAALFSFPGVIPALMLLEPAARLASRAFPGLRP
ncbi:NADH-quinone oxidoreductase subunit NuoN [soil metagenome]